MSFSKVTNPVLSEHETPDDNVEEKSESSEKLTKESTIVESEPEENNKDPVTESSEISNLPTWQAVWSNEAQTYYYWNMVTNETKWEIPQEMYAASSLYDGSMNNSITSTDQAASATTVTVDGAEYTQQEYYQYYYAQYGYYPEGYYYGYDPATYTSTQTPSEPPNPLESILDKIDTEVKSKLDGNSSSSTSQRNASSIQQEPSTTYDRDTKVEDSEYYSFLAQHGDGGDDYKLTARFNARTGKFQRDPTLTPEKFSADSKAIRQMSYFFDYDKFAEQRSKKTKLDDSSGEIKENKKLNKKDIEFFKQKKKEKKEMKRKAWLMGGE